MTTDVDRTLGAVTERLRSATVRVHDEGARGSGSGIVWAPGLVLTNAHVVRGGSATIEAGGERPRSARVVKRDDRTDLAALRIEGGTDLPVAPKRDSATLVPGELVIAVGNPHGFVGAVTAGLVHRASARWVSADVRLAPGNSGGPLADAEGRVVGINSLIVGGLALAIPSSLADAFVAALERRRLGVRLARTRLRSGASALLVTEIEPGSVAERSGLEFGDLLLIADVAVLATATGIDVLRGGMPAHVRLVWPQAPAHTRAA